LVSEISLYYDARSEKTSKYYLSNKLYITDTISLFRDTIIPETENTCAEMKNNAYFQDWEEHAGTLVFLLKYSKPNGITSYNTNSTFTFPHCNHCNAIIKIIK
jgi:hypothetical protein